MTITAIFKRKVAESPDTLALIDVFQSRDRKTAYKELRDLVSIAVDNLRKRNVAKGDSVLILVPMTLELYVCLLALFEIGAVAVFLDPSAGLGHIRKCCAIQPPRAFIGISKAHLYRLMSHAIRSIPLKFSTAKSVPGAYYLFQRGEASLRERETGDRVLPRDPALITFTSGSTGFPKATVRTHEFLISQHQVLERSIALKAGEVDLATLPVFVLANLASGVTSVLPDADMRRPGFVDPGPILKQIEKFQINRTGGSPAFYEKLLEGVESVDGLQSLKKLYTGGAPVFPRLLKKIQEVLPDAEVVAVYGSTEAEPIAHVSYREMEPSDLEAMKSGKGLLTGTCVPEIAIKIIRDQWGTPLPAMSLEDFQNRGVELGQVGEIVVSGNHVLKGYLHGKGDEETKFKVEDRIWHRTGDAGYFDDKRRLWLMGRCSAKVSDSEGELYPFAVEAAATAFDLIHRSAFIKRHGKRCLVIQLAGRASEAQFNKLKRELAWAKIQEFRIVPLIPVDKRHNAKINYTELEKRLNS